MKRLLSIALIFILVLIGVGIYGYFNRVKISSYLLTQAFQVQSSIAAIDLNVKSSSCTFHHLELKNPKPAKKPTALKVEKITVNAPYLNYVKDPIKIDEIHLDNLLINIEIYNKNRTEGNWQTLLANLNTDYEGSSSFHRTTKIKNLIFTNIHINIILSDGKSYNLEPIKRLEFQNISSKKGFPMYEVTEIITQRLVQAIFKNAGITLILKAPKTIIKGLLPFLPWSKPSEKKETN